LPTRRSSDLRHTAHMLSAPVFPPSAIPFYCVIFRSSPDTPRYFSPPFWTHRRYTPAVKRMPYSGPLPLYSRSLPPRRGELLPVFSDSYHAGTVPHRWHWDRFSPVPLGDPAPALRWKRRFFVPHRNWGIPLSPACWQSTQRLPPRW